MVTQTKIPPFREILKNGTMKLHLHPGQVKVWDSVARIIAMICGSQGGKTVLGPHWLEREIREKGPGDYLAVTSSYPLLIKKMLPEFLYVFQDLYHYGEYNRFDKIFTFHQEKKKKNDEVLFPDAEERTRVIIGSAQNPESLEAATAKAAWIDEGGQSDFKREAWDAILRRLAINRGRVLITTTLYCLGWLKNEIYDPWVEGTDPDIEVIQFDSTMNPLFPVEEFERMRRTMPTWKFDMFHRGKFSRPAGAIYDAFDHATHVVKPFEIPEDWPRYVGHDFGVNNTAALWIAVKPETQDVYVYREYLRGGLSTYEHVSNFLALSSKERIVRRVGGSQQEEGWRGDFSQAGWRIDKPTVREVDAGILKVYGFHKTNKLFIFRTCVNYLDEKQSYSYVLDEERNYQPTDKIENKERYHLMDAERYVLSDFNPVDHMLGKPQSKRSSFRF